MLAPSHATICDSATRRYVWSKEYKIATNSMVVFDADPSDKPRDKGVSRRIYCGT